MVIAPHSLGKLFYFDPSGNEVSDPTSASYTISFGSEPS
jgi:hypothetical protein